MKQRDNPPPAQPPAPEVGPRLLTPAETAAILRIHPVTVYRLVDAGQLRGVRMGRIIRVHAESLERLINGDPQPGGKRGGR